MEFQEKLQQLRKQHDLTQEQLAQKLFVSRTAVSKWESGRGYPNLESLKCISKLFSVSIDDLLSNDELVELAETANRSNLNRVSSLVFGTLDAIALVLLFMPLFGQRDGEEIRAVTILAHTGITEWLQRLYLGILGIISAFGIFEIIVGLNVDEKDIRPYKIYSVVLSSAAILLFAISRQPYVTVFLFLLFLVKVILIIQENCMK